ncbi:MAG: NUDIX domain-containing protein [Patescibacteria group bacterium]|nr:NUDIX domain-containing protein [Patescibacteria group bacterium]
MTNKKRFLIITDKIPEALYKEIHHYLPLICTDVVVIGGAKKKHFLLVKRKNEPEKGAWWFPGGRIFKNELLAEAAARKVKQETGLTPKRLTQLGIYEYFSPVGYFEGMNSHMLAVVYRAEVNIRDTIIIDHQSVDSRWFSAIDPKWHPYLKEFLKKAGFRTAR